MWTSRRGIRLLPSADLVPALGLHRWGRGSPHLWRKVCGACAAIALSDKGCCGPQVNGVALQNAEHHQAVEALRGAGASVQMRLWRERMVEPENAVTVTPLRPEDDYSPRERRFGGLRLPLPQPESPGPLRQHHVACLARSEKGLGFSIAGGKGSTPYRAGDGVSRGDGASGRRDRTGAARRPVSCTALPHTGHLHLPHRRGRRCPPGGHSAGRRPCPIGECPGAPDRHCLRRGRPRGP